ncbi:hypothetical protein PPYR_07182 [Photinus pyralis]|uniref:Apoptosis-stimulating of p53 protein 2-like RA domain-containing protein n=1 Tax=Photinus pyralis TaxID=7054 RepID=A0A1Y1LMJ4_PHOPY|nr:ras association domain-containing protein 10-like [Photinus pyralis]KAB0799302.1 hypothetical protein PPYR_07182 [Photinus pyralis]
MMWMETAKKDLLIRESDADSDSSGEELPIWIRGEQRWVSGVVAETTCQDIVSVLLRDEESRGHYVNESELYHITERWRGVEQPLDPQAAILDIWNAWGTAQPEVKISLRRIKDERYLSRKKRCRSDSSTRSDRSAYKTVHPRRLHALQSEKQPSSTEQLIKLVLAQGEVIRKQLRKLRHSEHQIGYLEEKTHKARVRKHGSNYLLETYLKGLSEAVDPNLEENPNADRHSDSGVVTEGDSEQSNHNKQASSVENERFSPSSEELQKDIKDDDTSSIESETTLKAQSELFEMISKLNKKLLKEEECLVRLHANIKKYEKQNKNCTDEIGKALSNLRTEMTKSACEMQHNEIVLEETREKLSSRKSYLDNLHKDLINEEQECEMLQALLYSTTLRPQKREYYTNYKSHYTKEVLDTLV